MLKGKHIDSSADSIPHTEADISPQCFQSLLRHFMHALGNADKGGLGFVGSTGLNERVTVLFTESLFGNALNLRGIRSAFIDVVYLLLSAFGSNYDLVIRAQSGASTLVFAHETLGAFLSSNELAQQLAVIATIELFADTYEGLRVGNALIKAVLELQGDKLIVSLNLLE